MISRYQGKCVNCGGILPKGSEIDYNRETKKASHVGECPAVEPSSSIEVAEEPPTLDKGVAGGSALKMAEARKERYEKIQAERKANVQERFGDGFMGKVAWFLTESDGPKDISVSWAKGAEGERVVGAWLDKLEEVGCIALHDRKIPGSKANIDHILVTPWGLWNVDAKHYRNQRIAMGYSLFGKETWLTIGGKRKDKLAETVQWESSHLLKWRDENGFTKETLPISTALCFVNAEWPLLGGDFWIKNKGGQVAVLWPKKLARYVLEPKKAPFVDVEAVARAVAKSFPKA